MDTNAHKQFQPSPQKPAGSHQSRTCWTFPRGFEAEIFRVFPKNRAKPSNNFLTTTFGELLFITQYRMCYAIYIPVNAKTSQWNLRWLSLFSACFYKSKSHATHIIWTLWWNGNMTPIYLQLYQVIIRAGFVFQLGIIYISWDNHCCVQFN